MSTLNQPSVTGSVRTTVGPVPKVSSSLAWADHWGIFRARWGVGRMHYSVVPGLYALGEPNTRSPVLVTANYKMSFDRLREALPGRDAWILVLDTRGINVWCAAGKGTFGTAELVTRLESTGLARIISHRDLILPQLGGSGIAAHEVKRLSGFSVIYGPIRARDLPAFLDGGLKATTEMRRKTFTIWERIVLIPVELVAALKWALILTAVVSLLGGLLGSQGFLANVRNHGAVAALVSFMAVVAGAVLTPLLLPWLPGRAFSLKGLSLGLAAAAVLIAVRMDKMMGLADRIELLGWIVLMPAMAAYLAMNFTGASTYTSLSGVKKEMRWAIPLVIAGFVAGLGLWVGSRFVT